MELNKYFDHTLLKPEATYSQIKKLCAEAKEYGFYSVCVNSAYVKDAAALLDGSDVKIASVIGFPLGACTTATKVFETEEACKAGANEIDMVINVGKLKDKDFDYVKSDIAGVCEKASEYGAIVKVILEISCLTDEEIVTACHLSQQASAHFVKTSTGFYGSGATAEAVALMKASISPEMEVKASGGIRDYEACKKMIEAGATRIGASASTAIMKEAKSM